MTKDQEDTLNMYEATSEVLHSNEATWTGNTPFEEAVEELDDNIESIGDLAEKQTEDTTGVTEDKQHKRNTLEEQTFSVARAIVFYASKTNNRKLLKKVNFTRTELSRARDNDLTPMCEQVHKAATDHAAALVVFGVDAAKITALGNAIAAFADDIGKPREAVNETSAATTELPPVFTATDKLLEEQLDSGMELYRTSHALFYDSYQGARIIVNSPTQKRALEVHFRNSVTLAPISHVKVSVDGSIRRRSSTRGNIWVQSLTEGDHVISASLPGYATAGQHFNVITGETTKITIGLVAV